MSAARPARPATLTAAAAGLYLVFYLLTVAGGLFANPVTGPVATALLVAYVGLQFAAVPLTQRLVGVSLGLAGIAFGVVAGAPAEVALRGLERTLPFLVLFAAVLSLQIPALASPSLRAVGAAVVRQPPGRRYLAVSGAAHVFGGVLNLAGLQFVATMIGASPTPALRERLALAMMRGFSAASCWSPLFVSTAVVLSVVPGLRWLDVAPLGAVVGAALIAYGWGLDRLTRRRQPGAFPPEAPAPPPRTAIAGVTVLFVLLVAPLVTLIEAGGLSIPIALGLVAPPFGALWQTLILGRTAPVFEGGRTVARHVWAQLPNLRNEALLFTGASLFGTGVAAAIAARTGGVEPLVGAMPPFLVPPLVVTVVAGLGLAGLHPVVPIVVIGAVVPPGAVGLAPAMLAIPMMVGWGLATLASPFSASSMYCSRVLKAPVWTVAWRWNAGYAASAAVLAGAVVSALASLF